MGNREPKTCITCKFRKWRPYNDGKRHSRLRYECWEHKKYRADIDAYIYDVWDVSGRHWKCDKYEKREK